MSADNWAICPKCQQIKINLSEAYGQVPAEEYLALVEKAKSSKSNYTLRENYEIGIHKGNFFVDYLASCEVCEFSFTYRYEIKDVVNHNRQ